LGTTAVKEFVARRLPTAAATRWNFTPRLCGTVKGCRSQLTMFFKSIVEFCNGWEDDEVVKARRFFVFLEESETIFCCMCLHSFLAPLMYYMTFCKANL